MIKKIKTESLSPEFARAWRLDLAPKNTTLFVITVPSPLPHDVVVEVSGGEISALTSNAWSQEQAETAMQAELKTD